MQLHQDAQVLDHSGAQPSRPSSSAPSTVNMANVAVSIVPEAVNTTTVAAAVTGTSLKTCAEVSPAETSPAAASQAWRRTGAFTGVAAVASAGIVLPLMGERAMAYEGPASETASPQAQAASLASLEAFKQAGESQALMPEIAQPNQAAFSAGNPVVSSQPVSAHTAHTIASASTRTANQSATASTPFVSSEPLIEKGADGNWTLSYQAQHRQEAQKLVTQLATETRSSKSQKACQGNECESIDYINSQLPEARLKVQTLAQKLQAFEALYGQQDMVAYQRVLGSRIAEINRQEGQLAIDMKQNQRFITQLKSRLMTVNADLRLPQQVIAQDASYQSVWKRLEASEKAVLDEFSKVDIDATVLNETYADYQYQQQRLQRTVEEALGNYLMTSGTASPDFISRAPAALNLMQDLVVATHDYQVQQLRQSTIATIQQRLQKRQRDLLAHMGEYEQLRRELAEAQQLVMQYEQNRDRLKLYAAIEPSAPALNDKTLTPAVVRAQALSLKLPDGSLAKTILGIAISAGAIATVVARRKHPSAKVSHPAKIKITPIDRRTLALYGEQSMAEQWMETHAMPEPSPASQRACSPYAEDSQAVESRLLRELLQITEPSIQALSPDLRAAASRTPASGATAITTIKHPTLQAESSFSEKDLIVESMTRELDEEFFQSLEESSFVDEQDNLPIDPAQLSVEEVDIFAERAVRWVLEDLGFPPKNPTSQAAPETAMAPALTMTESEFDPHPDSYRTNEFVSNDSDFFTIENDDDDLAEREAELAQGRYLFSAG